MSFDKIITTVRICQSDVPNALVDVPRYFEGIHDFVHLIRREQLAILLGTCFGGDSKVFGLNVDGVAVVHHLLKSLVAFARVASRCGRDRPDSIPKMLNNS